MNPVKRTPPVIEVDHRPRQARTRDDLMRTLPPSSSVPEAIERAITSLDEHRRAWERGFVAGIAVGNLARGTRDIVTDPDEEDTAPYPIVDPSEVL